MVLLANDHEGVNRMDEMLVVEELSEMEVARRGHAFVGKLHKALRQVHAAGRWAGEEEKVALARIERELLDLLESR